MKTVHEIRRENLDFLIEQYRTLANLNLVLGRKRYDGTLSQIRNKAVNSATGKVRGMGSALARDIEKKLNLQQGWMDQEHDEAQTSESQNDELEKHLNSMTIPLFETGIPGKNTIFTLFKGMQVSEFFIERIICPSDAKNLRIFLVDDNSIKSIVGFGSLVLLDVGVNTFDKDGLYLLEINGRHSLRKITMNFDGTYSVFSDLCGAQKLETLDSLKFVGVARYIWSGRNI